MTAGYSPQSGVGGVHIREDLGNLSIAYTPDNMTLIADQVFKPFAVKHESDLYWVWDKDQPFNTARTDGKGSLVADGVRPSELSFGATTATYKCQAYGHTVRLTDREKENADNSLDLETSKVQSVRGVVRLDYEVRVATAARLSASYASSNKIALSTTDQWNNASFASLNALGQSTIVSRIETGKTAVLKSTRGKLPNTIIIPYEVAAVMRNDQGLNDKIKFTTNDISDGNPFGKTLLGLNVIIPTGYSETIVEGDASSMGAIWGKDVIIAYIDPNPGLRSLTFGLTFQKEPWNVKSWREEGEDSTLYKATCLQDERVVTYDCAYIITTAIA